MSRDFDHLFGQNVRTVRAPDDSKPGEKTKDRLERELGAWANERACKEVFIKQVLDKSIELIEIQEAEALGDHDRLVSLVSKRGILKEMKQKFLEWAGSEPAE